MNKTINEYFETHTEPVELAFGTFYPAAAGNVRLVMRDGSEITAFDDLPPHARDFSRELGGFFLRYNETYGII